MIIASFLPRLSRDRSDDGGDHSKSEDYDHRRRPGVVTRLRPGTGQDRALRVAAEVALRIGPAHVVHVIEAQSPP